MYRCTVISLVYIDFGRSSRSEKRAMFLPLAPTCGLAIKVLFLNVCWYLWNSSASKGKLKLVGIKS